MAGAHGATGRVPIFLGEVGTSFSVKPGQIYRVRSLKTRPFEKSAGGLLLTSGSGFSKKALFSKTRFDNFINPTNLLRSATQYRFTMIKS
jgi:hypothetical protein